MSDASTIRDEVARAESEGREISEHVARLIASQWHGGQGSRLYSFASTGVLHYSATDTWGELSGDYGYACAEDRKALDFLGTFFLNDAKKAL